MKRKLTKAARKFKGLNSISQDILDWLMGVNLHDGEEKGPEWRRRLVSEVVATGGNWPVVLADRLDSELGRELFDWGTLEVCELDEYGCIGNQLFQSGLFDIEWRKVAIEVLKRDGFDTTAHLGDGVCNPRPAKEIEEYLARTAPEEVGAT